MIAAVGGLRLTTVYDAVRPDPLGFYASQLRLHVASWHAHVSSAGLTVVSVGGGLPPGLADFVSSLGADVEVRPAEHPLAERSPTYNKLLAMPEESAERVFLADNDTVYLSDVSSLLAAPADAIGVSLSDNGRITPDLWDALRRDADFPLIELDWIPIRERALAQHANRPARHERYAYFNSGAVLFPSGGEVWEKWAHESERLSAFLQERGFDDRTDAGSDQLSLTSVCSSWGSWTFLPEGVNVRPSHFTIEGLILPQIDHVHMVASGRSFRSLAEHRRSSIRAFVHRYWDLMILDRVTPDMERSAIETRDAILAVIQDYGLDRSA